MYFNGACYSLDEYLCDIPIIHPWIVYHKIL